jgi:3-methyladenine DNA glycosylase AlkD
VDATAAQTDRHARAEAAADGVTGARSSAPRFRPDSAARTLEGELRAAGTPERSEAEKRYLKSELRHYGVSAPQLRGIAKSFARNHPALSRHELLALVEALWEKPVHETRVAALLLLELYPRLLKPADFSLLERFIRESRTWALVDLLAVHIAGKLYEDHASLGPTLDRWASDPDFWVRRSALLTLLEPLRRGEGDFARFARYAEGMLDEREFFIRKAIGWVLREVSKKRPQLVYEWLLPRAARASGVTIREAVKYLPAAQRSKVLGVYAAGRGATGRNQRQGKSS